jgi:hypothetical protein
MLPLGYKSQAEKHEENASALYIAYEPVTYYKQLSNPAYTLLIGTNCVHLNFNSKILDKCREQHPGGIFHLPKC